MNFQDFNYAHHYKCTSETTEESSSSSSSSSSDDDKDHLSEISETRSCSAEPSSDLGEVQVC